MRSASVSTLPRSARARSALARSARARSARARSARAVAPLRGDAKVLVGAFLVSGTVHLVKPEVFAPLMPSWVPAQRAVILGSGVAELVCAVGLLMPATRRAAGVASAALLVGVFPGNLTMARDALRGSRRSRQVVAVARLPLQWPLIRGAWRAGRS